MTEAMQRLLERLQTGWQPTPAEIPAEVRQKRLANWEFLGPRRRGHRVLLHSAATRELSSATSYGSTQANAGCESGFWWRGESDE